MFFVGFAESFLRDGKACFLSGYFLNIKIRGVNIMRNLYLTISFDNHKG